MMNGKYFEKKKRTSFSGRAGRLEKGENGKGEGGRKKKRREARRKAGRQGVEAGGTGLRRETLPSCCSKHNGIL